jgi:hypothetical protein
MKLTVLILCIGLLSVVAVFARDLSSIARKERLRRDSIHASSRRSQEFTNEDLDAYAKLGEGEGRPIHARDARRATPNARRDLRKEESHWRDEKLRHERELARLDANIRRLEWRLRERQSKSRANHGVRDEPGVTLMEESLESMREQREQLETEFRERARKAGAFPGWLR